MAQPLLRTARQGTRLASHLELPRPKLLAGTEVSRQVAGARARTALRPEPVRPHHWALWVFARPAMEKVHEAARCRHARRIPLHGHPQWHFAARQSGAGSGGP